MRTATFQSKKSVKGRLQAALYTNRKKNRARREAGDPAFSETTTIFQAVAGFRDDGGGNTTTGYLQPDLGTATLNPSNRLNSFRNIVFGGGPTSFSVDVFATTGATSAVIQYSINGGTAVEITMEYYEEFEGTPAGWSFSGTGADVPVLAASDVVDITLIES